MATKSTMARSLRQTLHCAHRRAGNLSRSPRHSSCLFAAKIPKSSRENHISSWPWKSFLRQQRRLAEHVDEGFFQPAFFAVEIDHRDAVCHQSP